jgi:hypothetical protein
LSSTPGILTHQEYVRQEKLNLSADERAKERKKVQMQAASRA